MSTDFRSSTLLRERGIRTIFLVGFMGAGKTTIGQLVAKRLGWRFVDLDDEIENEAGISIPEIFRNQGEAGFRKLELRALQRLCERQAEAMVVALGGGAFAQPAVREGISRTGQPTVYLHAPLSELLARCRNSGNERPLAVDEKEFRRLHDERRTAYQLADIRVSSAGHSPARAARALVEGILEATQHRDKK